MFPDVSPLNDLHGAESPDARRPAEGGDLAARAAAGGFLMTAKRRRVVDLLETLTEPLDAEEIWRRLSETEQGCDRSLVYRTLRLLAETGAIASTGVNGRRRVYMKADGAPLVQLLDTSVGAHHAVQDDDLIRHLRRFVEARGYDLAGRIEIQVTPKRSKAPRLRRAPGRRRGG